MITHAGRKPNSGAFGSYRQTSDADLGLYSCNNYKDLARLYILPNSSVRSGKANGISLRGQRAARLEGRA